MHGLSISYIPMILVEVLPGYDIGIFFRFRLFSLANLFILFTQELNCEMSEIKMCETVNQFWTFIRFGHFCILDSDVSDIFVSDVME
jgi:hypothetical protein